MKILVFLSITRMQFIKNIWPITRVRQRMLPALFALLLSLTACGGGGGGGGSSGGTTNTDCVLDTSTLDNCTLN